MADSSAKKSGPGCMARLGFLLLVALFAGLITAAYFICTPQDLEDIGGYRPGTAEPSRDLALVLKKSHEHGHSLALTEAEINRWLSRTLVTRQGGYADKWVTLDGVWVRLLDGHAEVIQERTILGRPFTVSAYVSIERIEDASRGLTKQAHLHCGPYHPDLPRPVRGGRFGSLVVPQGFLVFVLPSYRELASKFSKEIELGFKEMHVIRFEKRKLILQPRPPQSP